MELSPGVYELRNDCKAFVRDGKVIVSKKRVFEKCAATVNIVVMAGTPTIKRCTLWSVSRSPKLTRAISANLPVSRLDTMQRIPPRRLVKCLNPNTRNHERRKGPGQSLAEGRRATDRNLRNPHLQTLSQSQNRRMAQIVYRRQIPSGRWICL